MLEDLQPLLIDMSELETLDYDMFQDVRYKGKPFTGKAYEKTEHFYTECSYLNGLAHGKYITIYKNGNKQEELELCNGEQIGDAYTWFDNGQMKEWNNDKFIKNWTENGILIRDYHFNDGIKLEYYTTSELMKSTIGDKIEYLTKSGKVFALYENKGVNFDHSILEEYLDEICDEDFLSSILLEYVSSLLKSDRRLGIVTLRRMLEHKNLHIQYSTINIIGCQDIYELKSALQDKINDQRIPSTQYDRYSGSPYCSYHFSLGDLASNHLKKNDC